ncbi:unnamed protein product [Vicia faba]|uniref:Uncharacterized protein n=1 Tax=Vicia faba TaxID=3906 RepID=A0AAV1B2P6_VICFA|nr:unnamed protein product [Vicia faba]
MTLEVLTQFLHPVLSCDRTHESMGRKKFHQLPVFVLKSNTMARMDEEPKRKPFLEEIDALEEVRLAIKYIVIPRGEAIELLPRRSEIYKHMDCLTNNDFLNVLVFLVPGEQIALPSAEVATAVLAR